MGWFLSRSNGRKTKRPRRSARKPASGASAGWDPKRTLLALKIIGGLGAVVGTVYGWAALERELTVYATRTRTQAPIVQLAQQPAWLNASTVDELKSTAINNLTGDAMDRVGLVKAAQALAESPWVAKVEQVRRGTDGHVIVQATYRKPVAAIRVSTSDCALVDATGVWLPTGERAYLQDVPLITGITSAPPRRFGETWKGDDVAAALALVGKVGAEPYVHQIAAIDTSERDAMGRVRLVMYSAGMQRVVWGLAPGSEKMVEPEADVKLARLRRVVRSSGTIDADGRGVFLNGATIMTARAER